MMTKNRKILAALTALVVVLVLVAVYLSNNQKNNQDNSTNTKTTSQTQQTVTKKACELFSLSDAKKLLGEDIKQTNPKGSGIDAEAAANVSSCIYSKGSQTPLSITVRYESSSTQLNKDFEAMRAKQAEKVTGYGKDAYWRAGKDLSGRGAGELVILEQKSIVIVSGSDKDLAISKQIASVIENNM